MKNITKKIMLKLADKAMFDLSQPATVTGIAQTLSAIAFFSAHSNIVKSVSAIVIIVAGLYNWLRHEITQAELDAKISKAKKNV